MTKVQESANLAQRLKTWAQRTKTNLSPHSIALLLWCVAIIAHYDDRMHWEKNPMYTIAPLVAAFGMFFTRSPLVMSIVLSMQIVGWWAKMPTTDNHWAYAAFASFAFLMGIAVQVVRKRKKGGYKQIDGTWYDETAPIVRWIVLLLYFFAVFHKLNWDFIETDVSCALHWYKRTVNAPYFFDVPALTELTERQKTLFIYGIYFLESSPFVLMLFRRTWFFGVSMGVFFHLTTGVFMRHFPTITFALYWVFYPKEVQEDLLRRMEGWARKLSGGRLGLLAFVYAQVFLCSAACVYAWSRHKALDVSTHDLKTGYYIFLRTWAVMVIIVYGSVVYQVLRYGHWKRYIKGHLVSKRTALHFIPLLFFLNGMAPYFGYKTSTSVAMWSNLIVANNVSNHMIIPANSLRLVPYMDDYVDIKRTSDKRWRKRYVRNRQALAPMIMLQRDVQRRRERAEKSGKKLEPLSVTYIDGEGNRVKIDNVYEHPDWQGHQGYLFQKIVHIKKTRKDAKGRCTW